MEPDREVVERRCSAIVQRVYGSDRCLLIEHNEDWPHIVVGDMELWMAEVWKHPVAPTEAAPDADEELEAARMKLFQVLKLSRSYMNSRDIIEHAFREYDEALIQHREARLVAVVDAAREVRRADYGAYVALNEEQGKPEDQWDEYDHMMIPLWRNLDAALRALDGQEGSGA